MKLQAPGKFPKPPAPYAPKPPKAWLPRAWNMRTRSPTECVENAQPEHLFMICSSPAKHNKKSNCKAPTSIEAPCLAQDNENRDLHMRAHMRCATIQVPWPRSAPRPPRGLSHLIVSAARWASNLLRDRRRGLFFVCQNCSNMSLRRTRTASRVVPAWLEHHSLEQS